MILLVTKREKEILELISNELNSNQIAQRLYISVNTVVTHRKKLLKKLGAQNSAGLVRKGFESGLLTINQDKPLHIAC